MKQIMGISLFPSVILGIGASVVYKKFVKKEM